MQRISPPFSSLKVLDPIDFLREIEKTRSDTA